MKGRIHGLLCFVCLLGLFISFMTPKAYACSRGPTTFEEDFLEASAIFTAKVTSVDAVYPSQKIAVVEPDKAFKGQSSTFVVTNDDSDQCGAGIEVGETYLFYSRGWDLPYVSVFDTHLLSTERAEMLTHWLLNRTENQQPKPPRTETILAYRQGEIRIFVEHHDRGYSKKSFITNNSIYVPLSFFNDTLWHSADWNEDKNEIVIDTTNRLEFEEPDPNALLAPHRGAPKEISAAYNDIKIKVKSETLKEHPEAFVSGDEIFVPLRVVAEKLGYEVEWVDTSSSVILHIPLEKQGGPKTLAMRYINNTGLEGKLEIERLTANEITYRVYHELLPKSIEVKPETVPFAELLKEELGYRKYGVQFYLKMDKQDIRLLVSHELLHKIESDASFREKVGAKLGQPMSEIPRNRILAVKDFE
ncbi:MULTISPECIES: stalk domain-containing protein [unclassified Paenibacillus]|uniref:stalk domain-containing protein n=1 Tax=unclassified Paenibacillus TaxID=185978 RepID=UPI00070C65E8|nr:MULTISPECIES: stalk domain-containing protein [unclassified Paenibacillus]